MEIIAESDVENKFYIGQRVGIEATGTNKAAVGTVRYIGVLQNGPDTDIWIGVEWDDNKRGKHNGTYNGLNFDNNAFRGAIFSMQGWVWFICQTWKTHHGKNIFGSGPWSLCTRCPRSFRYCQLSIRTKYSSLDEDLMIEGSTKKIELVGMDKISAQQANISKLSDIVSFYAICSLEDS